MFSLQNLPLAFFQLKIWSSSSHPLVVSHGYQSIASSFKWLERSNSKLLSSWMKKFKFPLVFLPLLHLHLLSFTPHGVFFSFEIAYLFINNFYCSYTSFLPPWILYKAFILLLWPMWSTMKHSGQSAFMHPFFFHLKVAFIKVVKPASHILTSPS